MITAHAAGAAPPHATAAAAARACESKTSSSTPSRIVPPLFFRGFFYTRGALTVRTCMVDTYKTTKLDENLSFARMRSTRSSQGGRMVDMWNPKPKSFVQPKPGHGICCGRCTFQHDNPGEEFRCCLTVPVSSPCFSKGWTIAVGADRALRKVPDYVQFYDYSDECSLFQERAIPVTP